MGARSIAGTYTLNSRGYLEDQLIQLTGGNHSVKAQYAGDNSFNASTATAAYTITPASTAVGGLTWTPATVGQQLQAQAYVNAQSLGAAPGGTVTFYINGNPVPGSVTYVPFPSNPIVSLTAIFVSTSSPFPVPGTYTLTATYSGDLNYQGVNFPASAFTVKFPPPNVNTQASASSVAAGSSVMLTTTVNGFSKTIAPTGTISFMSGTGPISAPLTYATVTDASTGNLDLQGSVTIVPGYTDSYSSQYSGDSNYPGGSGYASVTVNGNDFSLSIAASATVVRGSYTQVPMFVGVQTGAAQVTFATNPCTGMPAETTCMPNFTPVSNSSQDLLNITATTPHAVRGSPSSRLHKTSPSGFGLPLLAVFWVGFAKRRRALGLSLIVLLLILGLACGGGGGGGAGGGGNGGGPTDPGTPPGTYTITVTATSGKITHSATFKLIVQ